MKWALLLVVCKVQLDFAHRPPPPLQLELEPEPEKAQPGSCRSVDLQGLCEQKLQANECLHVLDVPRFGPPVASPSGRSLRRGGKGGRGTRARREALGPACHVEGPQEGFAVLYGNDPLSLATATVSLRGKASWRISGNIHFHRVRLEVSGLEVKNATLSFYNTSTTKDGGAILAGRGGLRIRNSTVKVVSSTAKRGGAFAISARAQLSMEHSTLVTERTNSTLDGGSIFARNVRLINSSVQISFATATDGGAMVADMLVAKSNSSIVISDSLAYHHGGATYSHKRIVLIDSSFRASRCDASQTTASKGGAIYAFTVELRNAFVEIDDAASWDSGACIHAVRSMNVQGSTVAFSGCSTQSHGAVHVGGSLQMLRSSLLCRNCSAQSGALRVDQVLLNASTMTLTQSRAQVPPVALEASMVQIAGGSTLSLVGSEGTHEGFAAVELTPPASSNPEPRSFEMSEDSKLLITDFFSGILSDGGVVKLRGAELKRLSFGVEMPRAEALDVADAVLEDVSQLAFSCGRCRQLHLSQLVGRRLGALIRAAEMHHWSLRDVQATCSRSEVACVQLNSALVFLDPEPWKVENVSLQVENVSSDSAPVLLDVEGPKVQGSHNEMDVTCPAGSFSFVQESGSSISKTAELSGMYDVRPGGEGASALECCSSTKSLPKRFSDRSFDFDFGIVPDMNRSCDPTTFPCVCTSRLCDRQILKTSVVSTRVSCMSCPMGQYSLMPYTRALRGDGSGLLGSSGAAAGDCTACTEVAKQVGDMPFCAGRSVRVPRGIMALPGDAGGVSSLRFFRCPHAGACPGGEMVGTGEPQRLQRCAPGYDGPGCSRCANAYGRQNLDPFECVRCGRLDLSISYFLLLPVVPLLLAVRSASQTEKERMSMVIKVFLSFGTFLATIQNILEQTEIYRDLHQQMMSATVGAAQPDAPEATAVLISGSFDCLVTGQASRWHYLAFQGFHSVVFLLIFLLLELYKLLTSEGASAFNATWVRRNIVLGNAFLPAILSAFLQWTPCFHMAKELDGSFESFAVFQVDEPCGGGLLRMVWMPCLGLLLFLALGPVFWASMLWRSRPWKNRKDYIGFLVAGYAPHCEWWEITVLLRKTLLMGALVLLPVSYAPMSLVIVTVLIMLAALVGHLVMRPYVDSVMNLLEGGILTYSMLALIMTLYLMAQSWTNTNKTMVFFLLIGSNAVVCLLLLVVFLIVAFCRAKEPGVVSTSAPAG